MKTIKFIANIGINEGYGHNNESRATFESVYQIIAENIFKETGLYISAISYKTKTLYHTQWGCPVGGEETYNLEGVANPQFVEDMDKWKETVLQLVKELKIFFKQSTITVEFLETDLNYLTD